MSARRLTVFVHLCLQRAFEENGCEFLAVAGIADPDAQDGAVQTGGGADVATDRIFTYKQIRHLSDCVRLLAERNIWSRGAISSNKIVGRGETRNTAAA